MSTFADTSDAVLLDPVTQAPVVGAHCTVWTADPTTGAGTQITAITAPDGTSLPGYVASDADGRIPFDTVDEFRNVFVQDPSGNVYRFRSKEAYDTTDQVLDQFPGVQADASQASSDAAGAVTQAASAATTVNAIKPDGGAKAVGKGEIVFRVADYGADVPALADAASAIQACMAAVNTAGGGTAMLTAGKIYALGTRLSLLSNVALTGKATLQMAASATGRAILVQNVSNVELSQFTIDMNKAATAGSSSTNTDWQGILISATNTPVSGIKITGVTVKNSWQRGIAAVTVSSTFTISNLTIDDCTISNVGDIGIMVSCAGNTDRITPSASQKIKIRGNSISGDGKGGIQLVGVSHFDVLNNVLDGTGSTGHGICFSTSGTAGQCTDFTCSGNKVRNYTAAGKWAIVASNNCKRFSISNNPSITGCTGGISVDPEDSAHLGVLIKVAGTVSGNSISGCVGASSGHGINARICEGLAIYGNTSNDGAAYGIVVSNSYGCAVTGNTANGNAGSGINIAGTNAGTGGHSVGPNTTLDNALGGVLTAAPPVACAFATTQTAP